MCACVCVGGEGGGGGGEGGVIPSWPTAGTPASERDGWLDLDTLHPHVK